MPNTFLEAKSVLPKFTHDDASMYNFLIGQKFQLEFTKTRVECSRRLDVRAVR